MPRIESTCLTEMRLGIWLNWSNTKPQYTDKVIDYANHHYANNQFLKKWQLWGPIFPDFATDSHEALHKIIFTKFS